MRRFFAELDEIVFQCVGSKESDWWSEIRCCHVIFKAFQVKSAAVTEFTVIFLYLFLNPKLSTISRTPFLVKKSPKLLCQILKNRSAYR